MHSNTFLRGQDAAIETSWPELDPRDTWELPGDAERIAVVEEDAAEAAQIEAEYAAEAAAEAAYRRGPDPDLGGIGRALGWSR